MVIMTLMMFLVLLDEVAKPSWSYDQYIVLGKLTLLHSS
jgi:hypothetical protein